MKIGFDLHGVLNTKPKKFQKLLKELIQDHHKVVVVSGPPVAEIIHKVLKLKYSPGMHYTGVISVVDYLRFRGVKMWQDAKGMWWASEEDWWSSKAKICEEYNVDVLIDDHHEYGSYFSSLSIAQRTRFFLYSPFLFPRLKECIYSVQLDKPINCNYWND